jgi:hypothetical protein
MNPLVKAAAAARDLASALAELAEGAEKSPEPGELYDSEHLPPRISRRRFAELCREGRVPGAYREGSRWVCTRESWRAGRAHSAVRDPASANTATAIVDRADQLLRRSGLRLLALQAPDEDES